LISISSLHRRLRRRMMNGENAITTAAKGVVVAIHPRRRDCIRLFRAFWILRRAFLTREKSPNGPAAERAKWLQTAANIFDLIYAGDGGITVSAARADRSPRPHDQMKEAAN
jgi:hypothetical protein